MNMSFASIVLKISVINFKKKSSSLVSLRISKLPFTVSLNVSNISYSDFLKVAYLIETFIAFSSIPLDFLFKFTLFYSILINRFLASVICMP